MKKVLIVSPNWPPVSFPDLHRARMALPYLERYGWEPIILKIDPNEQQGTKDPMLCETVPASVRTWQAGCLPLSWTRWCGVRSVGLRSHFHLAAAGDRIIRELTPDLVFFSTTMFTVTTLGRYWNRKHGMPYLLDFQDPWVASPEGEAARAHTRDLKYTVGQAINRRLEPYTLRKAAHVVSVSPAYPGMLRARYPWLREDQFTVLPFGAAEQDLDFLHRAPVGQPVFDRNDGRRHWVYVGRGGADMALALRGLFEALRARVDVEPALRSDLRLHFVGTDYAAPEHARKTIEPLALEAGLGDMVSERTSRLPYFEALQCLLDADALLVPGSQDSGYTASKIYPYVLARRPLLAIFNEQSSVVDALRRTNAGTIVTFGRSDTLAAIAARITRSGWLAAPPAADTNWNEFERYTARSMTSRLCSVFDRCTRN